MKKFLNLMFIITIVVCTLASCDKTELSKSKKTISDNDVFHSTESSIEPSTNSTTINDDESDFAYVSPEKLPNTISDSKKVFDVSDFDYTEYVDSQYDTLALISMDENYVYFEKWIEKFNGTSDLAFYKFDLSTGETTEFNGIVPEFNVKMGDVAFIENKIYSVMYNNADIVHYSLDTQTNTAEIIQKDNNTDSRMRTTLSVGKDSYMEIWATGNGYNETIHVMLFDKSGSREIITKKYNSGKERIVYTSGGDHIYEYAQDLDTIEPYLNIYNEKGDLESSEYLGEIAANLKQDPDSYVSDIHVSGRFIAFDMNFGESTAKSYIYDMEKKSFYLMDGCQSLTTPNYLPPDFGKIPFLLRDTSGEGTMFDLFCLYENGDIVKLVDNIGTNTMIIPNGGKIAYFNEDNQLYTVEY